MVIKVEASANAKSAPTLFSGRFERILENHDMELKCAQITLGPVGAYSAALVEIVYCIWIGAQAVNADVDSR
jgi:hypothetical protein